MISGEVLWRVLFNVFVLAMLALDLGVFTYFAVPRGYQDKVLF